MNKARRKKLEEAKYLLLKASEIITECYEEEDEANENLPESLQDSERGEAMQEYIEAMTDAIEEIDDIREDLIRIIDEDM